MFTMDYFTPPQHKGSAILTEYRSEARCTCSHYTRAICPRHQPAAYADCMARHATDSIR